MKDVPPATLNEKSELFAASNHKYKSVIPDGVNGPAVALGVGVNVVVVVGVGVCVDVEVLVGVCDAVLVGVCVIVGVTVGVTVGVGVKNKHLVTGGVNTSQSGKVSRRQSVSV